MTAAALALAGRRIRSPLVVVSRKRCVPKELRPCATHTMSSCKGEPIEVLAKRSDGTLLIQETLTTLANGFIELWLPRDLEVQLL